MSAKLIDPTPIPNMPWEDRPTGSSAVLWRYSSNPVIQRNAMPRSNSIFNSAVVPYQGDFAGVFRADNTARVMNIHSGMSNDGLNWRFDPNPIEFEGDPEVIQFQYRYDPRVCWIEDRYISQSPDMEHWGHHRWVMGTSLPWCHTQVGAGPSPISCRRRCCTSASATCPM
jgi:predicted GH43/DUF377 family glycosyl hydrolase